MYIITPSSILLSFELFIVGLQDIIIVCVTRNEYLEKVGCGLPIFLKIQKSLCPWELFYTKASLA